MSAKIEAVALELYCRIHGRHKRTEFDLINPAEHKAWLNLGRWHLKMRKELAELRRSGGQEEHDEVLRAIGH